MTAEIKLPELPEADGWIFQHEDTGLMTTLENDGINNPENFKENNPRHVLCEAIYSEKKLQVYARAAVELNRVVVDEAMVERAAIELWHRFAADYEMEWEEEQHRAEYRDSARAALNVALAKE